MQTDTSKKILDYIQANNQATPKELRDFLGISSQAVFKQITKLLDKKLIVKIGTSPKVFYAIKENSDKETKDYGIVSDNNTKIINDNFLYITPFGEKYEGIEGFKYWCAKRNIDFVKESKCYTDTLSKYDKFRKDGLINCIDKFKSTFDEVFLDKVFCIDFYSIEKYGKTKLGQLLLYAKQSQKKELIKKVVTEVKPKIDQLIQKYKIDAIGFVPPTVKREVQFMKLLKEYLNVNIPIINIIKIKTEIIVPQKSLNKLEDRVENAQRTIFVEGKTKFQNILLLDDAIGSGATLNIIAKKIREQGIVRKQIIGLAITGSLKGFEVINEV